MIFVATIALSLPILHAALINCEPAAGCIPQGEEEEVLLDFSLLQTSLQLSRGEVEQSLREQAASQKRRPTEKHVHSAQLPASVLSELLSHSWSQTSLAPKLWLLPLGIIISFVALFVLRYYLNSARSPDSDSSEPGISWGVYGILITQTLNALATQVVMPTMPFYAMQIGASAVTISLMGSTYNLAQMFCSPLLGNASDQVGRKRVMLVGILGQAVCNSFLSCARTPNQLLLARAAVGVALSTGPVEGAYIMDFVSNKKQLKKVTQLQTFLTSAGALAGPAVARSFGSLPFAFLCKGIVAINLLNFVIGCMLWEDKIKPQPKEPIGEEESAGEDDITLWQQVSDMFRNPATRFLLIVSSLYTFSFNIGEGSEMVLFKDRFGFTKDDSCIFFMCINVTSLIGALWVPKLIEILGALNVCVLGSFGGSLATLILVLGPQKTWVPYSFAVSIVGSCGSLVSLSYPLLVQEMCPENLGTLYGLQHSLNGAASAAASPLGGILYTHTQSFPFIASSVGFWITGIFYGGISKQQQKLPTPPQPRLERAKSTLRRASQHIYNDKLFMVQLQVKELVFELDPDVRECYELYKAHLREEKGAGGKMPVAASITEGLAGAIERKKHLAVDKSQLIEEGDESDPHVQGRLVKGESNPEIMARHEIYKAHLQEEKGGGGKMPVAATMAGGFAAALYDSKRLDLVAEAEPSSDSKTSASAGSDHL